MRPNVCKKVGATWPRETSISGQAPCSQSVECEGNRGETQCGPSGAEGVALGLVPRGSEGAALRALGWFLLMDGAWDQDLCTIKDTAEAMMVTWARLGPAEWEGRSDPGDDQSGAQIRPWKPRPDPEEKA